MYLDHAAAADEDGAQRTTEHQRSIPERGDLGITYHASAATSIVLSASLTALFLATIATRTLCSSVLSNQRPNHVFEILPRLIRAIRRAVFPMFREVQSNAASPSSQRTHHDFAPRKKSDIIIERIPHRFSSVAANVSPHWNCYTPSPHIAFLLSFCAYRNFYPLLLSALRKNQRFACHRFGDYVFFHVNDPCKSRLFR